MCMHLHFYNANKLLVTKLHRIMIRNGRIGPPSLVCIVDIYIDIHIYIYICIYRQPYSTIC